MAKAFGGCLVTVKVFYRPAFFIHCGCTLPDCCGRDRPVAKFQSILYLMTFRIKSPTSLWALQDVFEL